MKIYVFTIRNKATNELIYAEGAAHDEYYSNFELDGKWLTIDEGSSGAWYKDYQNQFSFDEEIRHLIGGEYEKIIFALESMEYK